MGRWTVGEESILFSSTFNFSLESTVLFNSIFLRNELYFTSFGFGLWVNDFMSEDWMWRARVSSSFITLSGTEVNE